MSTALRISFVSALAAAWMAGAAGWAQVPDLLAPATAALPAVKGVDGRWEGKLVAGGASFRIVFRIKTDASGSYAALDSPDQGASGIPVSRLARDGDRVTIFVDVIGGRYSGSIAADGRAILGTWSQNGKDFPLDLGRAPD